MKKNMVLAMTLGILLAIASGCGPLARVDISPASGLTSKEVCIIENPAVKSQRGFIEMYTDALTAKGYVVKVVSSSATTAECPITSTYTANWQWDVVMYMSRAEITVYSNGRQVGQATYDTLPGTRDKFLDAKKRVAELVNKLYPDAR